MINEDTTIPQTALILLVYPGDEVFASEEYKQTVRDWLRIATGKSGNNLELYLKVFKGPSGIDQKVFELAVDAQVSNVRPSSIDSFDCYLGRDISKKEETSEENERDCQHDEYKRETRDCAGRAVLLLLDEKARAFPCYGAWQHGDKSVFTTNQDIVRTAYVNRRFRNLCLECGYGIKKDYDGWFPCSRFGSTPLPEIWKGHSFEHIQFGDRKRYCTSFVPCFELSLENARVMLDSFLYPDFWRTILVDPDPRHRLENFWPEANPKEQSYLPLFGDYKFGLDTAADLDSYPAEFSYLHEPGNLPECKEMFLPVSIVPHLRVLFKKHSELLLLSVILSDRRYSEFNYRSIYRDGLKAPQELQDLVWKKVWRLPAKDKMPEWKNLVLNISSAVRQKKNGGALISEYIAIFDSNHPFGNTLGKVVVDFSFFQANPNFKEEISIRAENIRSNLASGKKVVNIFLNPSSPDNMQLGLDVWNDGQKNPSISQNLFFQSSHNKWKLCFDDTLSEQEKCSIGCRLINYVVWLKAILGESVKAVETFNSSTIGRKQPSQFVVFSDRVLGTDARAQFKLTLTSFMQPIEDAYALDDVIQSKVGDVRRIAFQNTGHTMRNRSESISTYFEEDFEPEWFKKYKSEINEHGYALQRLNAEQREYRRSWTASKTFPQTCMILELWRFDSPSSFWWGWESNAYKKNRFFDYVKKPLEIHKLFNEWTLSSVFSKKIKRDSDFYWCDVFLNKQINSKMRIFLNPTIYDPERKAHCHLNKNILAALFFEIFRNVANYGLANKLTEDDIQNNRVIINVAITKTTIEGKTYLFIYNKVAKDVASKYSNWTTGGYIRPIADSGKGIGMVSAVISNLALGDVLIKRYTSAGSYVYAACIYLKGLNIEYLEDNNE